MLIVVSKIQEQSMFCGACSRTLQPQVEDWGCMAPHIRLNKGRKLDFGTYIFRLRMIDELKLDHLPCTGSGGITMLRGVQEVLGPLSLRWMAAVFLIRAQLAIVILERCNSSI
jgi:hypothetical protein